MRNEHEIADLLAEAESLTAQVSDLQTRRQELALSVKKKLNALYERVDAVDSWASFIHDLEDLPGTREPKWYRVSVPFDYGDTQERFSQVQISATGPFVCTQLQAYYKVTDTDATHYPPERNGRVIINPIVQQYTGVGRMISGSSFFGELEALTPLAFNTGFDTVLGGMYSSYNPTTFGPLERGDGWNYPEFDLRIQTASNESFWTGTKPIPMAAVFGVREPLYLSQPCITKATDSLVVYAKPTIPAVNLKGSLEFVFHGYQINAHLDLERLVV
jgi:hypothetical protein